METGKVLEAGEHEAIALCVCVSLCLTNDRSIESLKQLGATLANSQRSEEALPAYQR